MDRYSVFCSSEVVLNEDINDEVVKGNIPLSLSCVLGGQNLNCCVLLKKRIGTGETWVPEPKIWKRGEK